MEVIRACIRLEKENLIWINLVATGISKLVLHLLSQWP